MRNNSTRQKGKKNSTSQFQSFEHNGMKIYDQHLKGWKAVNRKRRCICRHGAEGFGKFIAKDDRSANSRDVNSLETI